MKVIDSSAVLAFIFQEPGADVAQAAFPGAAMSVVNAAEVVTKVARDGVAPRQTMARLVRFGFTLEDADAEQAVAAAELHAVPGLSLGDRFCIALGRTRHASVVTADRLWAQLNLGVPVELIR